MVQAGNLMEGASSRGLAAGALTLLVCVLLVAAAVVDARERRFPTVLGVGLALACAALSLATGGLLQMCIRDSCWRCKSPVLFRATDQWFVSMDKTGLREQALDQVRNHVSWYPEHAVNRIGAMVEQRPDWCISRQRNWGVPIPSFTCADCGEKIIDVYKRQPRSSRPSAARAATATCA